MAGMPPESVCMSAGVTHIRFTSFLKIPPQKIEKKDTDLMHKNKATNNLHASTHSHFTDRLTL